MSLTVGDVDDEPAPWLQLDAVGLETRAQFQRLIWGAVGGFCDSGGMTEELSAPAIVATGALVGYARVSTTDQDPALQLDALDRAGCARVFVEHASGAKTDRPELAATLDFLREGDTLCVWRLDRLARSLPHLLELVAALAERGVALRSLTEQIDTSSAGGRLVMHVFGALAEFERELVRERTFAGLAAARARGRKGGRPSVMTPQRQRDAATLLQERDASGRAVRTYAEVAAAIGVSRATLVRHLSSTSAQPADDAA